MKMSKRAKRMERHHKARKRPGVNLISLMDIFTILVFFLLVNSSNVQQLPSTKDIRLPTSVASESPKETLVIFVTREKILVQGREVARVAQEVDTESTLISGLVEELNFQSSKGRVINAGQEQQAGRPITVMGDEQISYKLLRKILASCQEANYTRIAFATMQQAAGGEKG